MLRSLSKFCIQNWKFQTGERRRKKEGKEGRESEKMHEKESESVYGGMGVCVCVCVCVCVTKRGGERKMKKTHREGERRRDIKRIRMGERHTGAWIKKDELYKRRTRK